MNIVKIETFESVVYLRDPVERGSFLCGIECNEHGIALRQEGCSESAEMRIHLDHIVAPTKKASG